MSAGESYKDEEGLATLVTDIDDVRNISNQFNKWFVIARNFRTISDQHFEREITSFGSVKLGVVTNSF